MKHSPTPWRLRGHELLDKNGEVINYFGPALKNLKDASLIVKAVNTLVKNKRV